MSLYSFLNIFYSAIDADDTMAAWSAINFGSDVRVFADLDFDNAPDPASGPVVILGSPGHHADQKRDTIEYELVCWLIIDKSTVKPRADDVTEPSGVELIDEFIDHIKRIVKAALPVNVVVAFDLKTDTIGMLPEIHAEVYIDFIQRLTIGQDPLA